MKISELFETKTMKVDETEVCFQGLNKLDLNDDEIKEVIGMLRGLANAINGFKTISGVNNDTVIQGQDACFEFADGASATRFKECIDRYFSKAILDKINAQ